MKNLEEAVQAAKNLISEHEAYGTKPTKACSKRMRDALNTVKKVATPAKQELIAADKG